MWTFPLYPTREDRSGFIRVALDFARSFQLNGQQSDILTALERVKVPLTLLFRSALFVQVAAGRCSLLPPREVLTLPSTMMRQSATSRGCRASTRLFTIYDAIAVMRFPHVPGAQSHNRWPRLVETQTQGLIGGHSFIRVTRLR